MTNPDHSILILGAGSVGKRHLTNLADLGIRKFAVVDPRADRRGEAAALAQDVQVFETLGVALDRGNYSGAVVASPPRFHVDQCLDLIAHDIAVFLEKPVSIELSEAERLAQAVTTAEVPLLLGYTYRWWPPLQAFKSALTQVGKPLHGKFVMSAHLADWHPWEPYQDFFMSSKELGGGALLDESHFLDLMNWFFGMPASVFGEARKISSLEVTVDDNVDCLAVYDNQLRVWMHLDIFGRPHEKYISITGEDGTLDWRFDPNEIRFSSDAAGNWITTACEGARNDMFVEAACEFLAVLNGTAMPSCTIDDGVAVMRLIDAVRRSTETHAAVKL